MRKQKEFVDDLIKRLTEDYHVTIGDLPLARSVIQSSVESEIASCLREQRLEFAEIIAQSDSIDEAALRVLRHDE